MKNNVNLHVLSSSETRDHPLLSGSFQHDMKKRKVFREMLFNSEVSGGLWDPLGLFPMKCAHFRSPEWV